MAEGDEDSCSGYLNSCSPAKSREVIRQKLAFKDEDGEEPKNLSLCFMNEALLEEEETLNHSTALRIEKLSAQYIAQNNISRKKNHVIIPLTPCSEEANLSFSSSVAKDKGSGKAEEPLDEFSACLREIRHDAREKLRLAKSEAKQAMTELKVDRSVAKDLERLFGLKSGRKLSRKLLTDMNIAQLQVILNYLLTKIENLNEELVQNLIARDGLIREQDALLTDIEDITKGINSPM